MTFSPTTQLQLNGVWTDVSADVRLADGIQTTRGHSGEADSVEASSCALTLDNRSGDYSSRNPMGAYYGVLGRNTPLRVLGPSSDSNHMVLSGGVNPSLAADGPAGFASTNTVGPFTSGGDLDLRIEVEPETWRPATNQGLVTEHWTEGAGALAWKLRLLTTGHLAFTWSPDGTTANGITETSVVPVPEDSGRIAVRVILDAVAGIQHGVAFYTAPTIAGPYTNLGGAFLVSGSNTSVFTGASVIDVGRALWTNLPQMFTGKVYAFEFRNGIDGVLAVSADFTALDSGVTEWEDAQGNAWILRGRSVIVNPAARFHGEVSAWPQVWDKSETDVHTSVQAYGILRRLGQGSDAPRSILHRGIVADESVVAYWPCEDAEGATEFASAMPGHAPMRQFYGSTEPAQFDGFVASEPLPLMRLTAVQGVPPSYNITGLTQINFLLSVPAAGVSADSAVCAIRTTGSAQLWTLHVNAGGSLRLQAFNSTDTQIADSGFVGFGVNGKLLRVSIEFDHTGVDVDWTVATLEVGQSTGLGVGGTLAARTIGRIRWLTMNPRVGGPPALDDVAIGHVSVHNDISSIYDLWDELNAYTGELATHRILRLCQDQGVPVTIVGDVDDSTALGPQLPGAFLDLLREAADSDMGILFEPRGYIGLAYRTRASMYVQDAALTLDYAAGTVSGIEPTEDDDATRNDVTVSRVNGSSARAQLETGPLSVNAPPDGVGRYDDEATLSLERDEDLPDQASWRLHMGTVDEARYPVLGVNLANSAFTSDAVLTADARALDMGGRLVVSNVPASFVSPDDIQQLAQGFTETITPFEWLIDVNCTPASPLDVAVWDDASGPGEARYSSDGTVLAEDVTTTDTAIAVNTPSGPLWADDDAPFDIVVGGERMTLTAIADNMADNPHATSSTYWFWQNGTGGAATVTTETGTDTPDGRPGYRRATITTADTGSSGGHFYRQEGTEDGQSGDVLTMSMYVRASVAGTYRLSCHVRSGGVVLTGGAQSDDVAITANTWTRLSVTFTASGAYDGFQAWAVNADPGPAAGATVDATMLLVQESDTVRTYIDTTSQGFVVTRSVNGIVKTHASGAALALAKPGIYAL